MHLQLQTYLQRIPEARLTKLCYFSILLLLACIFLFHYAISGQAVYGDGIGYFAHLHNWVIDRDNNFANEYKHLYNPENNNAITPKSTDTVQIVATLQDGSAGNLYSPGPALLLLPAYVLAHGISLGAVVLGIPMTLQGYGDLYQILVGVLAVGLAASSIWLFERVLTRIGFSTVTAWFACITLLLTTNLFFYLSYDVINSHFAAVFVSAVFWFVIAKPTANLNVQALVLGLCAGFAGTIRPQDAVLLLIALSFVISPISSIRSKIPAILFCGLGCIIGLSPLLIHTLSTFGSLLAHPYFMDFSRHLAVSNSPQWLGSLFAARQGLFHRSPILLFLLVFGGITAASSGSVSLRAKKLLSLSACYFVMQILIVELQGGWQAAAYGGRMYLTSLPFFLILLASFIEKTRTHKQLAPVAFGCCMLAIIQCISIGHFIFFEKGTESGRQGIEQRTIERLRLR